MLSLRWANLLKELKAPGTTPVYLHARVLTLREESGEYEGEHFREAWAYADVLARVISLSRLTRVGPDEPLGCPRDVRLHFEPFPEGLRSGVEFRVAASRREDGTLVPLTSSLEVVHGVR